MRKFYQAALENADDSHPSWLTKSVQDKDEKLLGLQKLYSHNELQDLIRQLKVSKLTIDQMIPLYRP